jgi:hypothetical protein
MNTLVQALQSEGVVDAVIERALVKAELYDLENAIRMKVWKAIDQTYGEGKENIFEGCVVRKAVRVTP